MAKCPECGVEMVHISVSKGFPWICPDCGCKAAETVLSTGTGQAPGLLKETVREVSEAVALRREAFAHAFIEETGIKPSEAIMFQQTVGDQFKIWFEKKSTQAPAAPESGGRAEVLAWLKRGAPGLSGTIGGMSTPDVRMADAAAALIERDGECEAALRELVEAAKKIRHWHDAMPDNSGMVVSAEAVRELWETTTRCEAALPTKET